MAVVFNIVLPILAGLSIIAVFYFLLRSLSARSRMSTQAYGVGKVETRQKAQVNLLRALIAFFFALVFLTLIAAGPRIMAIVPESIPTPTPTVVSPTASPSPTAMATALPTRAQATVTSPVPTGTATALPTTTATPSPPTATVSSGVGIYLRGAPSTTAAEIEYLYDGTVLILLDGQEVAEDLQWQQVRTETGQTGWVAADFITVNEP